MYRLIGESIEVDPCHGEMLAHDSREVVALFTTKEKAEAYVEAARLKSPRREWGGTFPFRQSSLLAHFQYAEIEEAKAEEYPIDPAM